MKKTLLATLVAIASGLFAVAPVHAAGDAQKEAAKAKWEKMTPEEKAAAKTKVKARYDAMTPEEQAAAKKKFLENHPRAARKAEAAKVEAAPTK